MRTIERTRPFIISGMTNKGDPEHIKPGRVRVTLVTFETIELENESELEIKFELLDYNRREVAIIAEGFRKTR